MAAPWTTLNEHWPHATYQWLPEAHITAGFVPAQYMGQLNLGDYFVQARKIPHTVDPKVLVCYTVLVTTSALPAVVEHPHLFSRPHCHLRNLGFTDSLTAAFLSYLKYSFVTPALLKFRDPGYSVPICHICIFIWQGAPLLLARAPGGGRCCIFFSSSAILQCCITLASQSTSAAMALCRAGEDLNAAPHSCIVSLWFMLGYIIPTVHYCILKHYWNARQKSLPFFFPTQKVPTFWRIIRNGWLMKLMGQEAGLPLSLSNTVPCQLVILLFITDCRDMYIPSWVQTPTVLHTLPSMERHWPCPEKIQEKTTGKSKVITNT